MKKLKIALTTNAIFSAISGIILILLNGQIADIFGVKNTTVFWVIGLVLIYFSITIWYEISKLRSLAISWIIIQDFIWVIVSFILILFNPFKVTLIGNTVISILAVIVLFMGINQIVAYKHYRQQQGV